MSEGKSSPHSCPRCDKQLFIGRGSEIVLHGCGGCGGIFIDISGSERLAAAFPIAATDLSDRASLVASTSPDLQSRVACPACQKPMTRTRLPGTTLDIDICDHGTWFDRDELRLAAEALHPVKEVAAVPLSSLVTHPPRSTYAKGLGALFEIAGECLLSNDPAILNARVRRLERELGYRHG